MSPINWVFKHMRSAGFAKALLVFLVQSTSLTGDCCFMFDLFF